VNEMTEAEKEKEYECGVTDGRREALEEAYYEVARNIQQIVESPVPRTVWKIIETLRTK